MRPEDRGRWAAALAAGRRRWLHADVAERAVIASELDELFAELGGKLDQAHAAGAEPEVAVGPKHCALVALKAALPDAFKPPGAG